MNTFTVTCTIRYTFPVGQYTGFGWTAPVGDRLEQTVAKRTTMFTISARCISAALAEMEDKINRMKSAYIADGWECFETSNGGLIFGSDRLVFNHYDDWKLEGEISGHAHVWELEDRK